VLPEDIDVSLLDRVLCAVSQHANVFDRDGRICYVNLSLAQAWGVGRKELIGKRVSEVVSPRAAAEQFERMLARVFETGRQLTELFHVSYRELGVRDVSATFTPVFEPDGLTVRHVIGIGTDVTPSPSQGGEPLELALHDDELSTRRREVLTLVAQGLSNQEVARELQISVRTVETHRREVARLLGLSSRADFFRHAKQRGYV
jgi:PAS domain S-box-containing protein